ncbi:MAG: ABC transporter substrate-binding protein [Actinomycetales bacterium]
MRSTLRPSTGLVRYVLPTVSAVALLAACAPADSGSNTSTGSAGSTAAASSSAPASSAAASDTASASGTAAAAGIEGCTPDSIKTLTAGTLTLATDEPVYEPWFVDDKPQNGKGYEGAVAKAIAEKLGYTDATTTWVRVPFNAAISPGAKTFDADINEFSITDERKKVVDFSSPYYDVSQAVVAVKGSKAAAATSLADLAKLKLGAQVGTTSYDAINAQIKPSSQAKVYNTNDDAVKALENGQIDALVVDLPTAFYVANAQLKGGTIVGQLPQGGGTPEQFGLVLDKGSAVTECVSKAVDALKADGTLKKLEDTWLSQAGGAPVLS